MYCCNSQDLDDSAVGDQLLKSSEEQDPVTGVVSYTIQQIIIQQIVTLSKYGHDSLNICHP